MRLTLIQQTPLNDQKRYRRDSGQGFALVTVLVMMAFIMLLLSSLSVLVKLETTMAGTAGDLSVARQNAIFGMQVALGELQKYAGPDQRVTASADILNTPGNQIVDDGARYWTGVWRTDDFSTPGNFVPRSLPSGQRGTHTSNEADITSSSDTGQVLTNGNFNSKPQPIAWLVSSGVMNDNPGAPQPAFNPLTAVDPANYAVTVGTAGDDHAIMVGGGSIDLTANPDQAVVVPKVPVDDRGAYAFWVADESLKAKINVVEDTQLAATYADHEDLLLSAPQRTGAGSMQDGSGAQLYDKGFALGDDLERITQVDELGILNNSFNSALKHRFHDMTTSAESLLVDTAHGFLKEDLSQYLIGGEINGVIEDDDLFFSDNRWTRYGPANSTLDRDPFQAIYYPDLNYSNNVTAQLPAFGHIHSWANFGLAPNGGDVGPHTSTQHGLHPMVTFAAFPMTLEIGPEEDEEPDPSPPSPDDPREKPSYINLHLTPIVTLWNPYNVSLPADSYYMYIVLEEQISSTNGLKGNIGLIAERTDPDTGDTEDIKTFQWDFTIDQTANRIRRFDQAGHHAYVIEVPLAAVSFQPGEVKHFRYNLSLDAFEEGLPSYDSTGTQRPYSIPIATTPGGQTWNSDDLDPGNIFLYSFNRGSPRLFLLDQAINSLNDLDNVAPLQIVGSKHELWLRDGGGTGDKPHAFETPLLYDEPGGDPFYNRLAMGPFPLYVSPLTESNTLALNKNSNPGQPRYGTLRGMTLFNLRAPLQAVANPTVDSTSLRQNAWNTASQTNLLDAMHQQMDYYIQDFDGQVLTANLPQATGVMGNTIENDFQANLALDKVNQNGGMDYPLFDLPSSPERLTSLGSLQHANLAPILSAPMYAAGNSWVDPRVGRNRYSGFPFRVPAGRYAQLPGHAGYDYGGGVYNFLLNGDTYNRIYDASYLINESLWDRFTLLGVDADGGNLNQIVSNIEPLPNGSLRFHTLEQAPAGYNDYTDLVGDQERFELGSAFVRNAYPFNVNSTSVEAWKAFLGSFYDVDVGSSDTSATSTPHVLARTARPHAGTGGIFDAGQTKAGYQEASYTGVRALSDDELDRLARYIVDEVKLRGPFRSLGEFVNRRLVEDERDDFSVMTFLTANGTDNENLGTRGTLQAAIDKASRTDNNAPLLLNEGFLMTDEAPVMAFNDGSDAYRAYFHDPDPYRYAGNVPLSAEVVTRHNSSTQFSSGGAEDPSMDRRLVGLGEEIYSRLAGVPGFLTQADILTAIGPSLTTRGDTFLIRAYGESINPLTGERTGRAWCEAVVQRQAEIVADISVMTPADQKKALQSPVNMISGAGGTLEEQLKLGRQFRILSFRWLDESQI